MSKVVLVTGGSTGIGKAICEFLSAKGCSVYGTSRNPDNYPDLPFPLLPLDVTENDSISNCIALLLQKESRIDVLVNNAGSGITGPLEETPEVEMKRNFETNFFGPINLIKSVLPQMRLQNSGLIINVTSIAGYMGLPYRGIYSASKGALNYITEAFRLEIKDFNIKMCNLAPGDFATNIAAGRYHAPIKEDSPYAATYKAVLKDIDTHVDSGSDPVLVAKAVHRLIGIENPKVHYKVGTFMQKFSVLLKAILPSKTYEKLLERHHKL
ncbi:MAG: SDR family oxidoreductase [Bacteroidia bacterium]|nr:SDR family oxidoreductase [Bacteroidia bacterium]